MRNLDVVRNEVRRIAERCQHRKKCHCVRLESIEYAFTRQASGEVEAIGCGGRLGGVGRLALIGVVRHELLRQHLVPVRCYVLVCLEFVESH